MAVPVLSLLKLFELHCINTNEDSQPMHLKHDFVYKVNVRIKDGHYTKKRNHIVEKYQIHHRIFFFFLHI